MAYTTINKSSDYFNTKTWTGTGSSNALTGLGHQSDFVWIKQRGGTTDHHLYDAVRGTTKALPSNDTAAETTKATGLTAFGSDGFTLGADAGVNGSSNTYAGWSWKANGAGSANTDGSINTTATSVNTTAGFSISKYTGTGSNATVGHGLGKAPKFIIIKKTSGTEQWVIGESASGFTKNLHFLTAALNTSSSVWNDTAPTSTVFSVGTNSGTNSSGETYIAYCWSEIIGFSKFGDYTGNGSADGTFVYTGFKPAFVLSKNTSATQGWFLIDNKRANPYNPVDGSLHPNSNAAEDTSSDFFVDFTSNGFKVRDTDAQLNASGNIYLYMAFAEASLVGTNNIPCVAR